MHTDNWPQTPHLVEYLLPQANTLGKQCHKSIKCMYLFRHYKWILEEMAIIGNCQNKRMEKNRSFPNKFQHWPENSSQQGLWIICPKNGTKPQCPTWNQVLAHSQRLLPSSLAHYTALPMLLILLISELLISLPRDFMYRTWSLPNYFWTLLALGHGSKFHLQSIPSLFSTYQNPLLPWKPSLKLTPDPEVSPSWLHFFLPRGQPSVVWVSAMAVRLVSKLSPELLFKQGLH